MRRFALLAGTLVVLAALTVGSAVGGGFWKAPPFSSIGIHNVYTIGADFDVNPDPDAAILRVFMETGSSSEACLVTMGEAYHAPQVWGIFCSSRNLDLGDGRDHWGVMVTLDPTGELIDDPDPSWYSMNVYQEGAKFFGEAVRWDGD